MKKEKEIRKFVEQFGGEVLTVQCGKHWKVKALFNGKTKLLVFSKTPSDHRTVSNKKAELRRYMK